MPEVQGADVYQGVSLLVPSQGLAALCAVYQVRASDNVQEKMTMLTTNNIKPRQDADGEKNTREVITEDGNTIVYSTAKIRVLTTDNMKPRPTVLPDPDKWEGINRRETKKYSGEMLTTDNFVEKLKAQRLKDAPPKVKKPRSKRKKK